MSKFSSQLALWYRQNARDLPWRHTRNPYYIWISEIIFQQTRIGQGTDYYLRFIDRFPTVSQLAEAEEQEILRLWQGLGYYSRARNLHFAAKQIMKNWGGNFPQSYDQILQLKGVGTYTAAAISSIAFGEKQVVVDGNVLRFLARYGGITEPVDTAGGKKRVTDLASSLIDPKDPGNFNQALMEFGALYCTPRTPDCPNCIFHQHCKAFASNRVNELPLKSKKIAVRKRYFNYCLLYDPLQHRFLMHHRGKGDIWQGLYEFPLLEDELLHTPESLAATPYWKEWIQPHQPVFKSFKDTVHQLSHQQLHARCFVIDLQNVDVNRVNNSWLWVDVQQLARLPIPKLIENLLASFLENI